MGKKKIIRELTIRFKNCSWNIESDTEVDYHSRRRDPRPVSPAQSDIDDIVQQRYRQTNGAGGGGRNVYDSVGSRNVPGGLGLGLGRPSSASTSS